MSECVGYIYVAMSCVIVAKVVVWLSGSVGVVVWSGSWVRVQSNCMASFSCWVFL